MVLLTLNIGKIVYFYLCMALTIASKCKKLSSCSCEAENGTVTDLHSIATKTGIKYQDLSSGTQNTYYSFNPCYSFTESDGTTTEQYCNSVAACQKVVIDPNTVHYYDIGTQESVSYEYVDGSVVGYADGDLLAFNFVSADKGRISQFVMLCYDGDDQLAPLGEVQGSDPAKYVFLFVSRSACWVEGKGSNISAGSVLLIVFFSVAVVLFTSGMVYNKFVKQKSGKNIIPQWEFLTSTGPALVKDGTMFVVKRGNYQPIK